MENNIPTAREILEINYTNEGFKIDDECTYDISVDSMIEFAAMHVKLALQYALEEVPYGGSDEVTYEDVEGILTCYPIENIK